MTGVREAVAEALGTFLLVLFGPGAVMVDAWSGGRIGQVGVAIAFGAAVAVAVFTLGPVSGAHINPAVTVALWRSGRFPGSRVAGYVTAQCLGATSAALILRAALGDVGDLGATVPALPLLSALGVEIALSLVLMLSVLATSGLPPGPSGTAATIIGTTVGLCALVGGPLTGASMNPARSLGPALAGGVWAHHWLYWLGPVVGTTSAAGLSRYLRPGAQPRP